MDDNDNKVPVKTVNNPSTDSEQEDGKEFLDEPPFNTQRPATEVLVKERRRSFLGSIFYLLMVIVFLAVLAVGAALAIIYILKI